MRTDIGLLLAIVGVLFLLTVAMAIPFLQYVLIAVVLAYALAPVQDRLAARTDPRVAAGGLVLAATLVVIIPVALAVRAATREAIALLGRIREGEITFETLEEALLEVAGVEVDLTEAAQSAVGDIGAGTFESLLGVFGVVAHAIIGLGLTVFLLFFFLKDGDRLWGWMNRRLPLPVHVQQSLYERVDAILGGVLAGHVLVAIVQGVLAGIGLFAVGIPNALLWTVVMIVLSLLPIIGSFLVWGPAVVFLVLGDRPLAALALFVYGAVIVGISDDYLRPIVMNRYAAVSPAALIVGVLGGVYVLGFMGIFFGPVIIGAFRAAIEVFDEEYGALAVGQAGD